MLLLLAACSTGTGVHTHPSQPLLLGPDRIIAGQTLTVAADGLWPGEEITLVASIHGVGDGPCLESLGGCLGVRAPFDVMGVVIADEFGRALWSLPTVEQPVLQSTIGLQAWAVHEHGARASEPLEVVVVAGGDADDDGVPRGLDCNDEDPAVHPGAIERCDGIDNDCDPTTLEVGSVVMGQKSYPDLETAVHQATDGATIELCEGSYVADDLHIDESIVIRGSGAFTTLHAPVGSPWPVLYVDGPRGGGLVLEDLVVVGNGHPIGRGLEASHGPLTMRRVRVDHVSGVAIASDHGMVNASHVRMSNNGVAVAVSGDKLILEHVEMVHNHKGIELSAAEALVRASVLQRNDFAMDLQTGAVMSMVHSEVVENGSGCGGAVCLVADTRLVVTESDFGDRERDNRGQDILLDASSGDTRGDYKDRATFVCEVAPDGHGSCSDASFVAPVVSVAARQRRPGLRPGISSRVP